MSSLKNAMIVAGGLLTAAPGVTSAQGMPSPDRFDGTYAAHLTVIDHGRACGQGETNTNPFQVLNGRITTTYDFNPSSVYNTSLTGNYTGTVDWQGNVFITSGYAKFHGRIDENFHMNLTGAESTMGKCWATWEAIKGPSVASVPSIPGYVPTGQVASGMRPQ